VRASRACPSRGVSWGVSAARTRTTRMRAKIRRDDPTPLPGSCKRTSRSIGPPTGYSCSVSDNATIVFLVYIESFRLENDRAGLKYTFVSRNLSQLSTVSSNESRYSIGNFPRIYIHRLQSVIIIRVIFSRFDSIDAQGIKRTPLNTRG